MVLKPPVIRPEGEVKTAITNSYVKFDTATHLVLLNEYWERSKIEGTRLPDYKDMLDTQLDDILPTSLVDYSHFWSENGLGISNNRKKLLRDNKDKVIVNIEHFKYEFYRKYYFYQLEQDIKRGQSLHKHKEAVLQVIEAGLKILITEPINTSNPSIRFLSLLFEAYQYDNAESLFRFLSEGQLSDNVIFSACQWLRESIGHDGQYLVTFDEFTTKYQLEHILSYKIEKTYKISSVDR